MLSSLFAPHFAIAASGCANTFLTFIPWDYYLDTSAAPACQIINFNVLGGNSGILLILLAILDDLFKAAGLLAVAFVIYAGAKYILSQGVPDEAAKAQTTVINALVGLGIAGVAIAFVSYLGAQVGNQHAGSVSGGLDLGSLPNPIDAQGAGPIRTALGIAFGVLGAISFLIIVIAGMQYVLSQGDAQAVAKAKNAIIYALIGLVIAVVAQSVVSLVLNFRP